MQMNRRTFLGTVGAASLVGMTRPAFADALPIRIGVSTSAEFAVIYYGIESGVFAKHGLDAKPVNYPSGVEMVNGLLTGAQEVNTMGSLPFLAGLTRGFPLVLIGHLHGDPVSQAYLPHLSIVAAPKLSARSGDVSALVGKTIGLPRGASAEGYLRGIMHQNGIADDKYTMVNLAPSNMIAALRGGDVDAVSVWEPFADGALRQVEGAVRISLGGCKTCYDPGTILTTRQNVTSKAEELRRFMVAVAECQQWVRKNGTGAAVDVAMRWIPGLTAEAWRTAIPMLNYDLRISKRTIDNYKNYTIPDLKSMGTLKSEPDIQSAVDPQFSKYAEQKAPEYFSDLLSIPPELRL
jgi:NitT/TauT family transport system substrate-binding protein/sulfonate transport system substrate-binding protein